MWNLLAGSENCLSFTKVNIYILIFYTLYHASNNIIGTVYIFTEDNTSLSLANSLYNYLLCILCRNTSEVCRSNLLLQSITYSIIC